MSDISLLKDMILPDALVEVNASGLLKLIEDKAKPKYSTTIKRTPSNTVAIRTDEFPAPEKLFESSDGQCKRGDYVIISEDNKNKITRIIYIEMEYRKKGKGKTSDFIYNQLSGSCCVMEYCKMAGQLFWHKRNFLDGKNSYEYYFLLIDCRRTTKRKTKIKDDKKPFTNLYILNSEIEKIGGKKPISFNKIIS